MRVLITGVNGFIGSHIAQYFIENSIEIVGWDLNVTTTQNNRQVDILKDNIKIILEKDIPDIVIHCAGYADVGYSLKNPLLDYAGNTTSVYRLLEAIRQLKMTKTKFLFLSSAAVYGQPNRLPIKEDDPLHPMSPYAMHKKFAEEICKYYTKYYGLQCKIARIFSAYGVGLKKQIFWDMCQKIKSTQRLEMFGTGDESRDFIYIEDLVQALYLIATDDSSETIYNVANGKEITIKNCATEFGRCMGINEIEFNKKTREGDPKNWCADITRLKKLGYSPRVSLVEGIERYVNWCMS